MHISFLPLTKKIVSDSFIPDDMRALIKYCAEVEGMPLSVLFAGGFDDEMIFIVRKLKFIWRG